MCDCAEGWREDSFFLSLCLCTSAQLPAFSKNRNVFLYMPPHTFPHAPAATCFYTYIPIYPYVLLWICRSPDGLSEALESLPKEKEDFLNPCFLSSAPLLVAIFLSRHPRQHLSFFVALSLFLFLFLGFFTFWSFSSKSSLEKEAKALLKFALRPCGGSLVSLIERSRMPIGM